MGAANNKAQCVICNQEQNTYNCKGCSKEFCLPHLREHRQRIERQLEEIINDHNQFQQTIIQQKENPQNSSLIEQINQWERNSIHKIQQTAQECRETVMKLINHIETKFIELSQKLKEIRQENEFNEFDLDHFQLKLTQITQEFIQPSNISIQEDSPSFISKISVISSSEQIRSKYNKWKQHGIIIAGGNGRGEQSNKLYYPAGIFINHDNTIFIADCWNHRIIEWKCHSKNGQIIVGGNGEGNSNDQLSYPRDVIVDKKSDSLIITDWGNKQVMRWFRQNQTKQQILISDIDCYGLSMDKNGFIYVSDWKKNEVRRWKEGDTSETIVAGGNDEGDNLNQLNCPTFIFVNEDDSVYVSDCANHRVMKWRKNAKEGIVVAGGNRQGNSLKQLSHPAGVIVDHLGQIYVADGGNDRIMRWCEGDTEGSLVVAGNGRGEESNQLNFPSGLSFDDEKNLYVADLGNNRIMKYDNCFD